MRTVLGHTEGSFTGTLITLEIELGSLPSELVSWGCRLGQTGGRWLDIGVVVFVPTTFMFLVHFFLVPSYSSLGRGSATGGRANLKKGLFGGC